MSRTIEQIRHILQGSQRWNAHLQWYDFLLAIEFHRDGTGEMLYGYGQGLRSDINFRYAISADLHIHFEFFDTRTREKAFRTVAFQLLDGPFVIDEPYNHQHSYRYLLRFSSDPFPESEGPPEGKHGPYYDPSYLDYYGWKREQETKTK